MFGLFYSLVLALFKGTWVNYSTSSAISHVADGFGNFFRAFSHLLQNVSLDVHTEALTNYNDIVTCYDSVGANMARNSLYAITDAINNSLADVVAGVIATVTVIGVVLVTLRAVKSIFRVFLAGRLV